MKMKAFTREKLKPLIERHQRTLTLDDVDAIIELDSIACRIEKECSKIVDRDWFRVGDRFYSKPTFARLDLIDKINQRYTTNLFNLLGVLYALDLETKEFTNPPSMLKLLAYKSKVTCTISEIQRELEANLSAEKHKEKVSDDPPENVWRLCCILARESGGSPDEWYKSCPSKIKAAVETIEEKYEAEARAAKGKKGPPKETPRLLALKEFKDRLDSLEASWQA
jgi:hypothetical protein